MMHMEKQRDPKRKSGLTFFCVLLWLLFLLCTGVILYLSFQNGEDAKEVGKSFLTEAAQRYYHTNDLSEEVMTAFTYKVRQGGRLLIFFVLGVLGTGAVHLTFRRIGWFFRMLISVLMLLGIAVFTERFKIYLPTRHFSSAEMMLSIYGAMLGFVFVSVITLVFSLLSALFRFLFRKKDPD